MAVVIKTLDTARIVATRPYDTQVSEAMQEAITGGYVANNLVAVTMSAAEMASAIDVQNKNEPDYLAKIADEGRIATYLVDNSTANRKVFLDRLVSLNAVDLEAFVRAQINVDEVTNLASAKIAMKRLESAVVVLLKLLVTTVKV